MRYLYFLIYILTLSLLYSQPDNYNTEKPLTLSAEYTGDMVSVVSGGLQKGMLFLGIANFKFDFETEKAGLWQGGKIFLNAANTHGARPSLSFIGDYQIASNIEAGDHTYIQELWIQQILGNFKFIFGIQDLSTEFAGCCSGGLFLNSSFGIHPTIATNIPASVFPLTSIGITAIWNISQNWKFKFAIYDGAPTAFEQNPYNLKWKFNQTEGIINILESEHLFDNNMLKIGLYHHDHLYQPGEIYNDLVYEHNVGVYSTIDFLAGKLTDYSNLFIFGQASLSSRSININYWFASLGLRITNPLCEPGQNDELGFAIVHAGLRNTNDETSIELTYKRKIYDSIYFQPDIQFIINPVYIKHGSRYSLVFSIRTSIEF